MAFYPASIGSAEKPAPTGVFKVKGVAHNPTYHYDPRFGFKGGRPSTSLRFDRGRRIQSASSGSI
ncbi:MAG: L,D-transpeptidase [Xanthobacteraceae bacterium]